MATVDDVDEDTFHVRHCVNLAGFDTVTTVIQLIRESRCKNRRPDPPWGSAFEGGVERPIIRSEVALSLNAVPTNNVPQDGL